MEGLWIQTQGYITWPLPSKASNTHPKVWTQGTGQGPQWDQMGKKKGTGQVSWVGDQDSIGIDTGVLV